MSGRPVASHQDGYSRLKTTNLSYLPQGMDHQGVRDFRQAPDHVIKPPPTLVRNHLHGSDMFIRNQLEAVSPPKLHRSTTPSPSYTDSDYFSASSRGTPPPLAHVSPDLIRRHHEVRHPPTSSTPQYTDNHHTRSNSYQFSLPRPANSAGSRSRARRRHSSIEFPAQQDSPSRSENGQRNSIPSRPQSSASNVQDPKVISDRLNRHQSYYEAVNNEAVTSQTIFTHSTDIRPLIEETNGPDQQQACVPSQDEACTNGIDLEMIGSQEEPVFMYHPQVNGEVTAAANTFPRQKTNGQQQQSSPRQSEGAHPRLLNSTGSPLPLQSISPKPYPHSIPVKYSPPHYHQQRNDKPRHFSSDSYDTNYITHRPPRAFIRSNTLSSSSPYTDKRQKHKPPPLAVPELSRDECFSDGEFALQQGTLQPVGSERKKDRKRNKSFTSVSSPSPSSKKTSSRPRSISSHVLQRIAKNFSRRGDLDHPKVLHVFDEKDCHDFSTSSAYLGSEDSIPLGDGEMSELLIDRMSINNALATQDYHRTQSMEMLSTRSVKPAGTQSMDDLLNERPSTPRSTARGWGSRRKKSASMDTDVFTDVTAKSGNRKTTTDYREAMFKAVMNNNTSQVEQFLGTGQIDLAWHNNDDLTVLDIAVMLNHTRVAHLLMAYGAKESSKFVRDPESRHKCLLQLVTTAEEHMNKYRTNLSSSSINTSTQALEEMSRLKEQWSTKKTMLHHMISVYNSATPPDPPANVTLGIASSQSLTVRFCEPKRDNGAPVTRYRVEWSKDFNFTTTEGSFVLSDLSYKLSSPDHARYLEYTIPDLESGTKYFVRVSAYNMKKFGPATYSTPTEATPSSWHDIDGTQARYSGSTGKIQGVAMQLKQVITELSAGKDNSGTTGKGKMKRGLSKIFGGALKFHKNLKTGLYLACLMYTDDVKVLVTVDDYLPIIEVAESFNNQTIKQDFLWLSKLACTWENVRSMRDNSENYTASSSIQFRNRLLHIITDLQASLGVLDLGLIHPLPYQNSDSLVIVLVRNIKDCREIQNSSLHWAQWGKLWKKHAAATAADQSSSTIPDQLITEAQFMMDHNSASIKPVERGLYLGYLKTRSSLAGVKVVVSKQFPNLLPHTKIRDNPHVSKDEWAWLTYLHQSKDTRPPNVAMETCCELQKLLTLKVTELLTSKGITSKEDIEQHRIYVKEVVELNEDVSFLLLLPPPDQVCTSFGDTDRFEQVSYMGMPFTSFEIAQLYTYQKVFITLYTQVSSTLEMELLIAQHRLREAFSKDEISKGKVLQSKLEQFQQETEQVWKDMHWLDSAVQIGRKSDVIHGVLLRSLRKNPMTSQSRSSSMSFTTSLAKKEHDQYPAAAKPAHFEKHISTFPEELKVTPLYDTGLAKGSTVKLHIVPSTLAIEVVQLAVGALHEANLKRHPDNLITPSDPSEFYLLCTLNDSYDERILDDDYPMLELYRESTNFKLFLKKKSDPDSSDSYTTSV